MAETRKRIIDQAFRLFLSRGYHNVSLAELVEAAGVTKGGFYHHFKSKDQLYVEVLHRHVIALFDGLLAELDGPGPSARETVRRLFTFVLDSYDQMVAMLGGDRYRGIITLLFSGISRFDHMLRDLSERYAGLGELLARTIEAGKSSGEVARQTDSRAAAFQLMALGEGTGLLWALDVGAEERASLLDGQFTLFWRSVAADGER